MTRFIGRKQELAGLKGLLKKKSSSLVVIRGRRRIGKSRLAEEFSKAFTKHYMLTGVPPEKGVTAKDQRDEFRRQMRRLKISVTESDDWGDLLTDLANHSAEGSVLVVLDEITWMGSLDPTFLPKLKTIWDTHFKKNPQLILVISGSNSAWIEKNIMSSTGFVGRLSFQIHLKELPLFRCSEFWGSVRTQIDPYEKFKVLAVTGGIPRYLEEVRTELSAEQNILQLCYQPTGILFNEFEQIFSDLFAKRNRIYKELVRQIANGQRTLTEIVESLGRTKSGDFSEYLEELVEAGFLARDAGWNIANSREERPSHYRVCDNYVRFYLKYIEPFKNRILAGRVTSLPQGWKSIMGLQFENLVYNNADSLLRALAIAPDEVIWSGPYIQMPGARRQGCQIDYLIQTKHRVLYVCEIKFSDREVPYSVVKEIKAKSKRLKVPKGFSIRHVLIHVNGVSEQVEQDENISNIVNFGEFLLLP
ncbi:MAG: AAA family ATPase [Verrucomicrobia bacterium]|nr:AAA family ATPase [Verrucomicrobiota bacterium]